MNEEGKRKEELQEEEFTMQALRPNQSLKHQLCKKYQDQVVTVQFKCSGFMKKATGCLNLIGCDFLELVRSRGHKVKIDIFSPAGQTISPECAFRVLIPLKNVCAVELMSRPPCPPCKED